VDPRTLREIMSEGATRPETPQERRELEQLEADLESSPVRGKPLGQRLRNFRPDPDSGVRALGGPAAWMRRLRAIEDAVEQHERRLEEAWTALAETVDDPTDFATAWRELAESWSLAEVNELIERHNRNFPPRRGWRWIPAPATSSASTAARICASRSMPAGSSLASPPDRGAALAA
jgi:hypothetical protein